MGNAGQFKAGDDPRRNTQGRAFSSAVKAAARKAPGVDGVVAYAGWIQSNERNSKLVGQQKWIEFANAYQHPVVAIAVLLRWALWLGVKWSLQENTSGSPAAKKGLEVCEQGLLKARLSKPWNKVVAKAANKQFFEGFSIHATGVGRRKDGTVVFTEIEHRPPHTIEQWWRESRGDRGPFVEVTQRTVSGQTADIPLDECLYLVNDAISDTPDGTGVLRLVLERLRRVSKYEGLEGREMFTNMGGMPIPRAPIEEIRAATTGTDAQKDAAVVAMTQALRDVAGERVKSPETQPYMMLDSATFKGSNPDAISAIKKWDIEIVKGEVSGLVEIRKTITDETLQVARVLGIEFVMVGGGDTAGTFGMHESKVDMFVDTMNAQKLDIAGSAEQQLLRRLCVLNGLDPDEACPTLVASPIKRADVMKAVETIAKLNMAGLPKNHPAKPQVFEAVELAWQEEDESEDMLPRFGFPPRASAVDQTDEEVDDGQEAEREAIDPKTEAKKR